LPQLRENQLSKIASDTVKKLEVDRGAELGSADRRVERAEKCLDLVFESSTVKRSKYNSRSVSFDFVPERRESVLYRYAPIDVGRMVAKSETI